MTPRTGDPALRLESLTAGDIMSSDVVVVAEQESVVMAGYLMRQGGIHHLPVVRGEKVVGLLDERVLADTIGRLAWSELQHPVHDVMHRDVVRVHPGTPLRDVAVHLGYSRSGGLVVTDGPRLVGVITASDVVAAVARSSSESGS